ncbi:uncharacterized protein CCR75_006095 [Bremia lactucae]|uniref:Uncharacterized protein n=1 Tax=Bremia lactucae TaxID=4779 RepID=A0A976FH52_BRELC|nr:hypothetical protein CCR75_006095 [Bremia lactucae]
MKSGDDKVGTWKKLKDQILQLDSVTGSLVLMVALEICRTVEAVKLLRAGLVISIQEQQQQAKIC